ncbi:hypothetical protein QUF79_17505 [Fictibacillus enclensis]|uniref:hypothetical protein n=1 Tax=Fictibacillus enclensis TaxID=1017270 RepID=UPI0025A0A1EB|nr:hypothetical protein [Fictibacillus enclensis]MDM5199813.1 hypothetical protein [Fictibacillus enclensis]
MKTNEEAIWEIIKETFANIKDLFLSKEAKFENNKKLVREIYWFQQLENNEPSIFKIIEGDKELREYFSSRKMVRKLLRDKEERQRFKGLLNDKLNCY